MEGGGSSASRKTLLTVLIDVAGGPPRQLFNLHKSSIESAGSVNTGDTLMICSPKTMEKGYNCQHLVEIGTRVGSKLSQHCQHVIEYMSNLLGVLSNVFCFVFEFGAVERV